MRPCRAHARSTFLKLALKFELSGPEAEARHERTLAAVGSRPLFGAARVMV